MRRVTSVTDMGDLDLSPGKEVYFYIHGYNNDFEDAAFAAAELWHFAGREGVPIFYTWPAGAPGPSGYIYDRESGEFTLNHLKSAIGHISSWPHPISTSMWSISESSPST